MLNLPATLFEFINERAVVNSKIHFHEEKYELVTIGNCNLELCNRGKIELIYR